MMPETIDLSLLHAIIRQAMSEYPYNLPEYPETDCDYNKGWSAGLERVNGFLRLYENPLPDPPVED